MCATDIGSGACWLQVHGPTEKSARGILPDRVERCAPMVLKDRDADKVKVVAAATVGAVATVDEVAEVDAARMARVAKRQRNKQFQETTTANYKEVAEDENGSTDGCRFGKMLPGRGGPQPRDVQEL